MKVWIPHETGRDLLGPLPEDSVVEVMPAPGELPSDPADLVFWVPPFLAKPDVVALVERMPALRVVQLMTAGADAWAGRLPQRVTLCDARGVHDSPTAEWVVAAILSYLRCFPEFVRAQERGHWGYRQTPELAGKRILIVGSGSIGRALEARLLPFEVSVTRVARRARPGVHGVDELPALLPAADVVVLLVPLTTETTGLVDKGFLQYLGDGALLVNAARGPVVDTAAVTEEAMTGRIGFAADVTDPEPLPADHALWRLPNVLITPHVAGSVPGLHRRAYGLAGEQLRRLVSGAPLDNIVTDGY
ncbi:2-hydroxyacid dehydrogenase [Dactylosporangium sp. NPDC005572]|uniref:2-hydroxyacid dehydrogenase n=1 Tax=Dactylosporangium sp. NPDC005572 TaxID=3156889 RepID=UPI0033B8DF61